MSKDIKKEATNLSKIKRDKLLSVLDELKESLKFSGADEEKITALLEIQNQLTEKRYGLIWEEHEEEVDRQLLTQLPVFIEDKSREIQKSEQNENVNFLLEGDNIHSLKLLHKTHKGKIDVIYIDPPYNTGKKDFKYGDKMVAEDDDFRHSKWLSFMAKRLEIARDLMTDESVIFISIDDREQAPLKMLCDSIFGGNNFITQFAWVASKSNVIESEKEISTLGANLGMFKNSYEYILTYRKTNKFKFELIKSNNDFIDSRITKNGNALSIIELKKGIKCMKDNIIFKGILGGDSEPIEILNEEGIIVKGGVLQNNVKIKAQFANPIMVKRFFDGEVIIDNRGQKVVDIYLTSTGLPYMKKEKKGDLISNVLSGYGDTSTWKKELEGLLNVKNNPFNHPKPHPLMSKLINLHHNKNAIVLDFFAGSGTTGHAVLELNKEDGGNRTFILCTNNEVGEEKELEFKKLYGDKEDYIKEWEQWEEEYGIARSITYKRLDKVINGYTTPKGKEIEGISSNLKYYKTSYVPLENEEDDDYEVKEEILKNIVELIQLENCLDISNPKVDLILTDEDFDEEAPYNVRRITLDRLKEINILYVSEDVLLPHYITEYCIKNNVKVHIVPKYYNYITNVQ